MLLDWPPQYPGAMRVTFEALLEKIAREMDFAARSALAARFEGRSDAPLTLLNEFFLAAPATMKDAILARNDEGTGAVFASIDRRSAPGGGAVDAVTSPRRWLRHGAFRPKPRWRS